jgi:type IV pilus assembly protein PilM
MPAQTVWGLDIGESGLKAVKMARGKKSLEVIRVDMISISTPSGAEEAAVDRETLVIEALKEFVRRHDPSDARIVASVQGRSTFCKPISLAPVEQRRIPEIVRFEVKQQIPFPIEDIVWDYFKCKESFAPGEEIEVNLVAIRKEIVENFTEMFSRAGIRVDVLQAAPLALYNLVKYEFAPEGNVVIIDIGAEITDLVIVEGDRFWPRTLPIAGKQITKALQEKFEIPFGEAEKLKISAADSKNYQQIFGVVKPVLKELVGEIHRTIGYYKSLSKDVVFDKIIFMGNATKLAGFEKFFGENLPYKIEVVRGLKNVSVSRRVNLGAFRDYLPGFAVALGLAVQGVDEGKCNVNLLPAEISGKVRASKLLAMVAGLVFVVLAFPAGMLIANTCKGMSARPAAAYDGIAALGVPGILAVQSDQDKTEKNLDEARRIQKDGYEKFVKPFRTGPLARYVDEEIGRAAPRVSDKDMERLRTVRAPDEAPKDLKDSVVLISTEYREVLKTKPAAAPPKGGKPLPPETVVVIEVEITGITKTVTDATGKKDKTATRIWLEKEFASHLEASRISGGKAQVTVPYTTGDFSDTGTTPAPTEKSGSEEKDFAVFKITWEVNPDAAVPFVNDLTK